jgi:hypothetical protein
MKMVMNRDVTVSGLSGHAIKFRKGIPTHVPPEMMEDVMAKGAIPAEGESLPEVKEEPRKDIPIGPRRKAVFFEQFEKMIAENNRDDFNAFGVPKALVIKRELGFQVDSQEVKAMWSEFKSQQGSSED